MTFSNQREGGRHEATKSPKLITTGCITVTTAV